MKHYDEWLFHMMEKMNDPNGWVPQRTDAEWEELRRFKRQSDLVEMALEGKADLMLPEQVRYIVLHCSRTPAGVDIGAVDLGRAHRARGYLRLGYHYVIRRCGTTEIGRPDFEFGLHTKGYNECSVAVCLIGGQDQDHKPQDNFTAPQYDSLRKLLDQLSEQFPDAVVVGHSDLEPGVPCPAFAVKPWLDSN